MSLRFQLSAFDFVKELEFHFSAYGAGGSEFTKRFGKRIKALGGRYSDVRGHASKRYVTVPIDGSGKAITLILELLEIGSGTIVLRNTLVKDVVLMDKEAIRFRESVLEACDMLVGRFAALELSLIHI